MKPSISCRKGLQSKDLNRKLSDVSFEIVKSLKNIKQRVLEKENKVPYKSTQYIPTKNLKTIEELKPYHYLFSSIEKRRESLKNKNL